ncbi:hypothetical protein L1987_24465 [Smallanthus sonchifolius]|uniref:Uncharacterized protein n=1 Tax=Smallanthus sonchifolius TaxID=185202 RepID=A0ACB9IKH0_9ASTR|nr:hypothetical protein L1987_24465 [Smallanthus sonchifolius]
MMLFQTKIRFLGHNIETGNIIPINRSIEFGSKFSDEIYDKTQLQRFLGSLNYILPYYKNLAEDTAIIYDRLKKNHQPWTENHTKAIRKIKQKVRNLPCLMITNPDWEKIIETDASDIGYGGILKQISPINKQESLVRFHSGKWNNSQKNYATIAKEILAIVKCMIPYEQGRRGRGRSSSYRGRGGNNNPRIISQIGSQRLIAKNIASSSGTSQPDNLLYKEFLAYKASVEKSKKDSSQPDPASYARATANEAEDDISNWAINPEKEVILLLEKRDVKWKDNPWLLIRKYMDTGFYPMEAYKPRFFYEQILKKEFYEIEHYHTGQPDVYNFSKIVIKQIISVEAWGTSPLKKGT